MRNATISNGIANRTALFIQGSNNPVYLHVKKLLEKGQIALAIDYALNAGWGGEEAIIKATKERIDALTNDPGAALNLMVAVRKKFPTRSEELILYLSKEMRSPGA